MISLVMVEEALAGLLSDNIECCAVELPDAKRGSRIVGVTNRAIDEKDISKQLSEELLIWRCQKIRCHRGIPLYGKRQNRFPYPDYDGTGDGRRIIRSGFLLIAWKALQP